jgi:hypothetical protein
MAQAIVFCGLRLLRPANPPTTKTIVCPAEQVAATTQWGGPPGLPSCCPAARRENRCDSLRIWRAAIQSICERFSNVRRGKKAGSKNPSQLMPGCLLEVVLLLRDSRAFGVA